MILMRNANAPLCAAGACAVAIVAFVGCKAAQSDALLDCGPGTEQFGIGAADLCVPTDKTGYPVRSSDKDGIRFKEQFFAGTARVTDVVPPNLARADGTPVVAVLTTILDRHSANASHLAIEQRLADNIADLRQNETTDLTIDVPDQGPIKFTFHRLDDHRLFGSVGGEWEYRHWLVMLGDTAVDYLLGCKETKPGSKRYLCDGELKLEKTSAAVLLVGDALDQVSLAFESNRDIVRSFVVP